MASFGIIILAIATVATAVPTDLSGDRSKNGRSEYNPDTQNQYHLFTRRNPGFSQVIVEGQADLLRNSHYNPSDLTVVLIHGEHESIISPFITVTVPAFLDTRDMNIIVVDWSVGAVWGLNGIESGKSVARVLKWIIDTTGANLGNFHIVGYHAGGHQAGIVGRELGGKVPYITACDPQYGWFYPDTLNSTDALYVEVIYTNAGESSYMFPIGHVNFYPNGGESQPGCITNQCSSYRSFYFLAESLRASGGFMGIECESFSQALSQECQGPRRLALGGLSPKTGTTGVFHLRTSASPPFALG